MKKLLPPAANKIKAPAGLIITLALFGLTELRGQAEFGVTGQTAFVVGAEAFVNGNGLDTLYNTNGPVTNGITAATIGSGFSMGSGGPTTGSYDNTLVIQGAIIGSFAISAGTTMPMSYDFSLAKQDGAAIPGNVNWSLTLQDSVDTSPQLIAAGTLSSDSATFSGNGNNFTFTSGASAGVTFSADLEITYVGVAPSGITGTMFNTGFGQQGITLNASAIPEPSTSAAIAGAVMLAFAVRRRKAALAEGQCSR